MPLIQGGMTFVSGQEHDGNNGTNPEREGFAQNRGETEREDTLTNRQGHPISDNQNVRTVGNRGPMTLENYHYLEKITHFDRERIPERVVHARVLELTVTLKLTGKWAMSLFRNIPAKLFQVEGKRTPVFVRFSTVIHGAGSPETLRDPRGFAVKFYTEEGNWDLVGNNLKIFLSVIRSNFRIWSMRSNRIRYPTFRACRHVRLCLPFPGSDAYDHVCFSPWGIPANYRQMQGSGVNTYKWVNAEGNSVLIKYHWEPLKQGIKNLTQEEASKIQAMNDSHATQDLYEAIERGIIRNGSYAFRL